MKLPFSKTKLGSILLGAAQVVKMLFPKNPEFAMTMEAIGTTLVGVGIRDALPPKQ